MSFAYWRGRLSNIHVPGAQPDIFIFSTPRSGSTLLLEILLAQPGVKVYNEPLSMTNEVVCRELAVHDWAAATAMPDRERVYGRYFQRLRENKVPELNRPLYWKYGRLITRRLMFKVLHGGEDMLPWFKETFGAYIVVLLRHPIATTLSHRQYPRLPHLLDRPELRNVLGARELAFAKRLLDRGDDFEKGILNWTLQNLPAMRCDRDTGLIFTTYEDLAIWPEETLTYLADRLALRPIDHAQIRSLVARPSRSTAQSDRATRQLFEAGSEAEDRYFLVEKWRTKVSQAQERRAFDILDAFGVDAYEYGSDVPTPRYRVPALVTATVGRSSAIEASASESPA